jgi:UDP-N-acetylglucosamine 2-epimerase (non-hydrolysing)
MGTNVLAGTTKAGILDAYRRSLEKQGGAKVPPLWDGMASDRIWKILMSG